MSQDTRSSECPSQILPLRSASNLVLLDNYDSFTWNVYQYLILEGATVTVYRNDEITLQQLIDFEPTQLVISPGPGHPDNVSGISNEAIRHFAGKVPVLGVCLGLQCIFSVFGGKVEESGTILHGKASPLKHNGQGLYADLPQDTPVARYHSLAGTHTTLPECLEVTSWIEATGSGDQGVIMGVRHKEYVVEGLQFHPESILTATGRTMLKNFLRMQGGTWSDNKQTHGASSTEQQALDAQKVAASTTIPSSALFSQWDGFPRKQSLISDDWSPSRSSSLKLWSSSQSGTSSPGSVSEDGGLPSPSWRRVIRLCLSEMPWLQNHKIKGAIVYPFAGYLCMVLQAAWQMAETTGTSSASACKLREIEFLQPLVIPDSEDGVEVVLSFSMAGCDSDDKDEWSAFTVASNTIMNGRTEHCRGTISIDSKFKWFPLYEHHEKMVSDALRECSQAVPSQSIYDTLGSAGVSYSADFQGIDNLVAGNNRSISEVHITRAETGMLKALETLFQISIIAPGLENTLAENGPFTPVSMKEIFVSGDFSPVSEQDIQVATHLESTSPRRLSSDLSAAVQQSDGPKSFIQLRGIELAPMRPLGIAAF